MKIVQVFGLSILIVLVVKVKTQLRETRFIKSVFEESSSSVTSRYSTSLSNMNSKYQCAVACSSDDLCTRFEFCPNSPSDKCTLYQSGSTCYEEHNEKTNAGCKCFRMKWLRYEDETCRCPVGYYGAGDQCCQHVIQDCSEGVTFDTIVDRKEIITFIKPLSYSGEPFEVLCSFSWGGVTKFQKRKKVDDATDFNNNWMNYRNGFGTLHGNFWLGLDKMYHILQNNNPNGFDLHIHLFDESYSHCMWYFGKFNLEGESSNYTAIFQNAATKSVWCDGMFTSLSPNSRPFSTFDHISYPNDFNCTGREESGWWFADDVDCSFSNLNSKRIDGDIVVKTANVATIKFLELVMQVVRRP